MGSAAATRTRQDSFTSLPTRPLWLVGGHVATGPATAVGADLEILNGRIHRIIEFPPDHTGRQTPTSDATVDLRGHLILPGLINAHDHLEFNLFPRLGRGPYSNYKQWAEDIYRPAEPPIREQLAVPKAVRLWWGGLKNLLSGVTTVCHHNEYVPQVFENGFPVRVVERFAWSHSLAFENNLKEKFAATSSDIPFVIHLGEGIDPESAQEIFTLRNLEALDSRTVIVHGVALDEAGKALLKESGAALVWCPTSNIFTLGKTLDSQTVTNLRRIALGSDSALTARGDLLDEIQFAHRHAGIKPQCIYAMVSDLSADALRLRDGEGRLVEGGRADLVAVKDDDRSPSETLARARFDQIELSMKGGEPKLFSSEMASRWPKEFLAGFQPLTLQETRRLVRAPVEWLLALTRKHLGPKLFLAGREVGL